MTDLTGESNFLPEVINRSSSETDLSTLHVGIRQRTCSNLSQHARRRRKSRGSLVQMEKDLRPEPPSPGLEQDNVSDIEMTVDGAIIR